MNPWALVVIGLGVLLIIIGVKGSQHNLVGALTGHHTSVTSAPGPSLGGQPNSQVTAV